MATYPSKRDWWILALLWVCFGLMIVGFVSAFTEPVAPWMRVFAAVFFAFFAAFTGWLLRLPYRTYYILDEKHLTIQVGPFKHRIPIAEITEVYPTRNPLSAPAWSLDRIRVRYTSSSFGALISPQPRRQFMAELEAMGPRLEREGERLIALDRRKA